MVKMFAVLGVVLFCFCADASIEGKWVGDLNFTGANGKTDTLSCIFEIAISETTVKFKDFESCTEMFSVMDRDNEVLSFRGKEIGIINENGISVHDVYDYEDYTFSAMIDDQGILKVREVDIINHTFTVEGSMKRTE